MFGVTVEDVRSFLPGAVLADDEQARGSQLISRTQVDTWIGLAAREVAGRIAGWEHLSQERQAIVRDSAGLAVTLAAAYWWEAARTQGSKNHSGGSYAQDLEDRYKAALDALANRVAGWASEATDGVSSGIGFAFQPPIFLDGARF